MLVIRIGGWMYWDLFLYLIVLLNISKNGIKQGNHIGQNNQKEILIDFLYKNKERIEKGLSPQIEIEIEHKATGKTMVVSVSMELEHTYLKQRGKSFKAHEFWNLTEATPWGHASMDKYRHISKKYKIIKVIKGISTF